MTSGHRKYIIIGLAVAAAILLVAFGTATYLVNSAKPRLEKIASARLGMQVTCRKLRVSFLPPSILARGVKISKNGAEVALIPTLRARIDLRRLVMGKVLVRTLNMEEPEFTVTRLEDRTWNIETTKLEKKETTGESPFLLPNVIIRDGSLILRADENPLEMRGINLTARDLRLTGDDDLPLLARLSLTGDFNCRELQSDKTIIRNFASHLQVTAGIFTFDQLTFPAFGGAATGKLEVNMSDESPLFGVHLELSRIRAGDFFASMTKEELLHGEMDLALDITSQGVTQQERLNSISGKASMTGRDLTTIRLNLDNLVEDFIQSQQFHLVDIGAIMILGPLGPVLTRSYDFSMLAYSAQGGSSEIRQVVSLWEIDEGRAVARDVALATEKSRIAMSGEVDIGAKSFRKLVVAVVDAEGCALVHQEINGSFDNPQVEKPSFIETAAGPIINIFRGTARLITGEECEVFYNGSVGFQCL
jgi:AsmA protein